MGQALLVAGREQAEVWETVADAAGWGEIARAQAPAEIAFARSVEKKYLIRQELLAIQLIALNVEQKWLEDRI